MQSSPPPAPAAPPRDAPEPDEEGYPDNDPSALTAFRDTLDPYGAWVEDPVFGLVWVPSSNAVGPDFQPYVSSGHWSYDTAWIWVSDYPWGWAPFHYGRWVQTAGEGWAWVPGRTYSGAWVDWRVGNGYLGWAPARPDWAWRNGTAVHLGVQVTPLYSFAPQATIFAPALSRSVVRGRSWISRTAPYSQVAPATNSGRHYGPPPAALGIPSNRVEHPSGHDTGLRRAVQYARPATAPHTNSAPPQPERAPPAQPQAVPNVQHQAPPAQPRPAVTAPQPQAVPGATTAPALHATTPPPATHPSTTAPPPAPARPTAAPQTPSPAPRGPRPSSPPPAHSTPKANPQR